MANTQKKADIKLTKPGRQRPARSLKYDLPSPKISMADTLMSEFSHLGLSSDEKNKLSRQHREYFCSFKLLTEKDIKKSRQELIKMLKDFQNEALVIKASETGALICLAAIFSGQLPQNTEWRFELEEIPLPFFPKELIKKSTAAQSFEISFKYHENGALKPFPTLKKAPAYMGLASDHDINEFRPLSKDRAAA